MQTTDYRLQSVKWGQPISNTKITKFYPTMWWGRLHGSYDITVLYYSLTLWVYHSPIRFRDLMGLCKGLQASTMSLEKD